MADYSSELTVSAAVRFTRWVLMMVHTCRLLVGGHGTRASYSSRMVALILPRTPDGVGCTKYVASPHSNVLLASASSWPA